MHKILFLLILFFPAIAFTQVPVNSLTLEEAIGYALENSTSMNIERMKLEEADIHVKESRLQHIPEIFLSGDLRRNLIIPATPVPANVFDQSAEEGELMYLKFNTKWNSSTGVNLNYDLFNPNKINKVAEQEHQFRIQEFDAQISEENLKESVALAYAECVIAAEQKELVILDTAYFSGLLVNANQLYLKEQIGLTERNDARRAYNESVAGYLEAERILGERKAELLYIIGMEVTEDNILSVSLEEDISTLLEKMFQNNTPVNSVYDLEEMRQIEMVNLADLRAITASFKYAPTFSLNGYYGTNFYNNELSIFNKNYWRGNSYIGLSITIPITQSLSTSKEVSRLRLQKEVELENLRDIKNNREKERLNELSLLQVRRDTYKLNRENWEMSQQNSDAVQLQFEMGYIQQTDLLNERLKIQQSRQIFLQSAYDLFSILISSNNN